MTLTQIVSRKSKLVHSSNWMISLLRILVRVFGLCTSLYWLKLSSDYQFTSVATYHLLCAFFYILFFVFLDWYIKISLKRQVRGKGLSWLKVLKWVPFLFTLVLLYLSASLGKFSWPSDPSEKIIYAYTKGWSTVFMPNMGFIIITILIFYAAALLNRNKKLQEETELTI